MTKFCFHRNIFCSEICYQPISLQMWLWHNYATIETDLCVGIVKTDQPGHMPNLIDLWVAKAQYCLQADSKDLAGHTWHFDGFTIRQLN